MPTYEILTPKFGVIQYIAKNIGEARTYARRSWKVGPANVTRQRRYKRCMECDSQPCVCKKEVP